jgi:ADP-heptose:LPS heptosyltransferase
LLGPAEADEAAYWRARGIDVLEGLAVLEAASVCALGDLYLGNDSGVSHLAGAVGLRGVALYGPTDPELWRPLSRRLPALRLEPWSGCDEDATEAALERVESGLELAGRAP